MNIALSKQNSKYIFKQSHSGSYTNLQSTAEDYFDFIKTEIQATENNFKILAAKAFSPESFAIYIEKLIPKPVPPSSSNPSLAIERAYETRLSHALLMRSEIRQVYKEGYQNSIKIEPAEPTLWGALNAVTAYVDHMLVFNKDKYAQIMFGKGDQLKQSAYNLAFDMLKA